MQRDEILIDINKANVFAIVLAVGIFIPLHLIARALHGDLVFGYPFVWLLCLCLNIPVHELLHAVAFRSIARCPWRDIRFGVIWESITPYCTCSMPMTRRAYWWALLLPTMVLGSAAALAAIVTGNFLAQIFAAVVISSGGGDFMIAREVHKLSEPVLIQDHPSKPGFIALRPTLFQRQPCAKTAPK